jgi:hypothetical protein
MIQKVILFMSIYILIKFAIIKILSLIIIKKFQKNSY